MFFACFLHVIVFTSPGGNSLPVLPKIQLKNPGNENFFASLNSGDGQSGPHGNAQQNAHNALNTAGIGTGIDAVVEECYYYAFHSINSFFLHCFKHTNV